MSDYSVTIRGSDELRRKLQELAEAAGSGITPAMQDIADHIAETSRLGFEEEEDPWGKPWKPLAESTKRNRRGGPPYQILRDQSHLFNSIIGEAKGDTATVGAGTGPSRDYARIHLFGGDAGRGHAVRIPARPYLPIRDGGVDIPPDMEHDLLDIITQHLEAAWKTS